MFARVLGIAAATITAMATAAMAAECDPVEEWRDGRAVGTRCRVDADAAGLTVISLRADWVPPALQPGPDGRAPAYRDTFLALAQARFRDAGPDGVLAARDGHLELFGIPPTLEVVHARLADAARHACHAAVDATPLRAAQARVVEESTSAARARLRARPTAARLQRLALVRAVQQHLACDGFDPAGAIDGGYTWHMRPAVERFQRSLLQVATGVLDPDTLVAFTGSSRERDLRTAIWVLRERVIAATGLIEDGSAGLDLVTPATAAALDALGWRDPASAQAALADLIERRVGTVAVALPPRPAYHTAAMPLEIEIDRGTPSLTVFTWRDTERIALARFPTTVGGWQWQRVGSTLVRRRKSSPLGPRIWRDLMVAPIWLAPDTTPDRELTRESFGPSYRAAFGLVAFVHHRVDRDGELVDEGIRTHATGNLRSLGGGASHGCHRLLGYQALRLATFVLAHRPVVHRGDKPVHYRRTVRHGRTFSVAFDRAGERIELAPPIAVTVLP